MANSVGSAKVDLKVDGSGVSDDLVKAMTSAMDRIADILERGFGQAGDSAEKSVSGISDAFDDAAKAAADAGQASQRAADDTRSGADTATTAARSTSEAFEAAATAATTLGDAGADAADSVSSSAADAADSLSDIGTAASESGATASSSIAASMADVSDSAARAGAAAADSVSGVGGAASESGATASSAMSNSMATISSSASEAFSSVSASAADAAAGVAGSAADMSASMSGALSGMDGSAAGAGAAVGGLSGKVGGLARSLGPAAAGLAGVAGAGATIQAGFGKLTSIEDTTASLGIILDDANAASDLMQQLEQDNLATPYMFDAYAAAGKTLAAFGADVEGIPDQVLALGEAAAASGGGQQVFDSMARSAGQAMATGKISMDTINQLATGGVEGLSILANEFDVSTEEMQKMISQGLVPADEGMDILTRGILEGTDGIAGSTTAMSGVMQEMSETTSGSMTNLTAAFTNLASAGIEPLKPGIQAIADGLTDFAYVIIDLINGEADLPGWLDMILTVMEPIAYVAGSVAAALGGLALATWGLEKAKKAATLATKGFSRALGFLVAHPVVAAIAAVAGGLIWFFTQTETGQRVWQGFMDVLGTAWEWLKNTFEPVWETISAAWTTAMDWIGEKLTMVGEGIGQFYSTWIEPLIGWFMGAGETAAGWLDPLLSTAQTIASFFLDVFVVNLQNAWNLVSTAISSVWNNIIKPVFDTFRSIIGLIADVATGNFSNIGNRFSELGGNIQRVVMGPINVAKDLFNAILENIGRSFEFFRDLASGAIDKVRDTISGVVDFISDLPGTIMGFFSDAGSWLVDAGKNIIDGLINGLKSMGSAIIDTILDLIPDGLVGTVKSVLGIESPSTVFAEIGENVGQGMIEGIAGTEAGVTSAAQNMADAATALDVQQGPSLAPSAAVAAAQPVPAPVPGGPIAGPQIDAGIAADAGGFAEMGEEVAATARDVLDPVWQQQGAEVEQFGATVNQVTGGQITPDWQQMGANITATANDVLAPTLAGLDQNHINTAMNTRAQTLGGMLPDWQNTGVGIQAVQNGTIDPTLAATRGAIDNTRNAFAVGTTGMINEWNRMREGTAAPARFAVNTVFNDGIVGMWNSVADMIGMDKMRAHPIGFASGTSNLDVLPGYTPGHDPHTFVDPKTGMSIGLSGGEAIMRPEVTRALGSSRVDELNAAARMGGVSGVKRSLGQYAGGGVIGSITGLVNRYFPGMSITSTRRNSNDYHGQGLAVDFSNGTDTTPQMQEAARFFHRHYGPALLELIHWPLNGWQNLKNGAPLDYGEPTNSQHRNHVHVAAANPLPEPGGLVIPVPSGGGAQSIDWGQMVDDMLAPDIARINEQIAGQDFPGMAGQIPGATFESMIGPMQETLVEKVQEMSAFVGDIDDSLGSVERWRPMVKAALARNGFDPSKRNQDLMLAQIRSESGGNPGIMQQIQDVNSGGNEAQGLLQVIPGTFAAHRDPALPNDRTDPWANMNAALRYYRSRYGGDLSAMWGKGHGYDQGGLAEGVGWMGKHIIEPERVLNPRQTAAFEAWMNAGADVDTINDLVHRLGTVDLQHPDAMAADIAAHVQDWLDESSGEGDLRDLLGTIQEAGIEWERVANYMARSAEAWANGDWVQVNDEERLATPEEMFNQILGEAGAEYGNELAGLVGAGSPFDSPSIVGESGLVTLPKEYLDSIREDTAPAGDRLAQSVAGVGGEAEQVDGDTATRTVSATTPAGEDSNSSEEREIRVDMTINVNGAGDPMLVADRVQSDMRKGLEQAFGGTVRSR